MRIKHWAGYGCVNAKKVYDYGNIVIVEVTGNHECGLERPFNDPYCIEHWLKGFLKGRKLDHYDSRSDYIRENGIDVEHAQFKLYVREA